MPPDISRVDAYRVKPSSPHWPLVFMTRLRNSQVCPDRHLVMEISGKTRSLTTAAFASFAVGALALGAVHPSPGTSHICLARAEDVEAVMAES